VGQSVHRTALVLDSEPFFRVRSGSAGHGLTFGSAAQGLASEAPSWDSGAPGMSLHTGVQAARGPQPID
jgi:hypothetical protein